MTKIKNAGVGEVELEGSRRQLGCCAVVGPTARRALRSLSTASQEQTQYRLKSMCLLYIVAQAASVS